MNRAKEMAGVFQDPVVVFPGGWGDTIPAWVREAIVVERLAALRTGELTATDAEVLAYYYTAALTQPLDSDASDIFSYVFTKTMRRWQKEKTIPPDLISETLSQYHQDELRRLKRYIYDARIKSRPKGKK